MKKPKKAKPPEIMEDLQKEFQEEVQEEVKEEVKKEEVEVVGAGEVLDKYQRCLAEFDNFRKRTTKEMTARYDDGIRASCEKLLPIVDNFERALAANEDKEDNFYKGIEMIARQFESVLEDLGVKEILADPGIPFDTNMHYAVAHTEDENFGENQVAAVMQKGYMHKERVIRPAMVKVAN